jgi:hypothetical protein
MDKKKFEVKLEHLKLLKRAYVRWEDCEFGAPSIDCKRPYGNSSVVEDMFEILYGEPKAVMQIGDRTYNMDVDDFEIPEELNDELTQLHEETETVLQIALATGKFEVGMYECEEYSSNWKKVE